MRFNAPGEILGCKSSLTNITGLQQRGFTVMLWKKSTEIFSGSSNSFFITTASDSNFANLFGDTHPSDFLFSNTDGWPFLPQEEFYNWHHYAVSVNMSSGSLVVNLYLDGVLQRRGFESTVRYAHFDSWVSDDPLLHLGGQAYHYAQYGYINRVYKEVAEQVHKVFDDLALFVGALGEAEIPL